MTMATRKKAAKSKAQSKAKSKQKPIQLPNGYKVIGRAPNWDVEKHPVIEGERSDTHEVTLNKGVKKGANKERTLRTCIVTDEEVGPVTVWESGMLKDFFDQTEEGDHVRIEFTGYGQKKPGQNAPKLFSCAVKE